MKLKFGDKVTWYGVEAIFMEATNKFLCHILNNLCEIEEVRISELKQGWGKE